MIEYRKEDILTANAEALVNSVNCAGVMGRGIALQFKKVFPANFKAYKKACDQKQIQPVASAAKPKQTRRPTANASIFLHYSMASIWDR